MKKKSRVTSHSRMTTAPAGTVSVPAIAATRVASSSAEVGEQREAAKDVRIDRLHLPADLLTEPRSRQLDFADGRCARSGSYRSGSLEEVDCAVDVLLLRDVVHGAEPDGVVASKRRRRDEAVAARLQRGNEAGVQSRELVLVVHPRGTTAEAHDPERGGARSSSSSLSRMRRAACSARSSERSIARPERGDAEVSAPRARASGRGRPA